MGRVPQISDQNISATLQTATISTKPYYKHISGIYEVTQSEVE